MVANTKLPLPKCEEDDTIFEYMVNEKGAWEHWSGRVRLFWCYRKGHILECERKKMAQIEIKI